MRASPGRRQMRKFGPSAAMYRYTAGRLLASPQIGRQCSERGEEVLIAVCVAVRRGYFPGRAVACAAPE